MRKVVLSFGVLVFLFTFSGCADMEAPGIKKIVTQPMDTKSTLKVGMNKDEVKNGWGDPDIINPLTPGQFGAVTEEWVYIGRTDFPVTYKSSEKTCYLVFEDDALVSWGEKETKVEEPTIKTDTNQSEPVK